MLIEKDGIKYTKEESIEITNKGEKVLKNYRSRGKCMYCQCNNSAIDAHTISEKGSLSTIASNDKVGYLVSKRKGLNKDIIYEEEHIDNVSIFKGFCSVHDNKLFKCIDNNAEIKTGKEILLQSYRSVCKALFEEGCYPFMDSLEVLDIDMIKEVFSYDESLKNITIEDSQIMSIYKSIISEHKDKILKPRRILEDYKVSIEMDIENNFSNISISEDKKEKVVITSNGNVAILYKQFDWRIPIAIYNHHIFKGEKTVDCVLSFTYIPYKNGAEVIWTFLNKDFDFFYDYWKWFVSEKINTLNTIESCMMALENWCIDPNILEGLPEDRKKVFLTDIYFNNERANIIKEYDMSIFDDIRIHLINDNMCNVEKECAKMNPAIREIDNIRKKQYERAVFDML